MEWSMTAWSQYKLSQFPSNHFLDFRQAIHYIVSEYCSVIRPGYYIMEASKKTILFIEDEQELLETVTQLLRDQGYKVVAAEGAEQAIELMKKTVPDLILADIKLPGMDGFDFFHTVRKSKEFNNAPFIFLTAYNDMGAMMYAKKAGAAEYITKPFDFEYLITRIRQLVPPQ